MKRLLKSIYHAIVPKSILKMRTAIKEALFWKRTGEKVRQQIIEIYRNIPEQEIKTEYRPIIEFLKKNKMAMICYDFPKKYKESGIDIFFDPSNGMQYTLYESKKLYFKKSWSKNTIKKYYNYLLVEQDIESPHRYLTFEFNVNPGDIVVDAGAAEGIFALSIIENISKAYLFEPDDEWVEALKATFAPWKDKVVIIPKFLGKTPNENTVTIDDYFEESPKVDFIKIDVEGHEQDVLLGAESTMATNNSLKIAVCTYHKQNDDINLKNYLRAKSFKTSYSDGFIVFFYDLGIQEPYFRYCLIRATSLKTNS